MVVVRSLSCVWLFATPWIVAHQVSLSFTISRSLLRLMSTGLIMPSNHLILCCRLLLLPSVFPSIRVFSSGWILHIRWPKYWSFSFSINPSSEYSGLISFRITLLTCEIRWFPSANGKPLRKDRSTLSAGTESQKHCAGEADLVRAPIVSMPIAK